MNPRLIIEQHFRDALTDSGSAIPALFPDDLVLLKSGLDSLGFAVLVTQLETSLGYDPFTLMTEPFYPRTFGELVEIYERFAPSAS